MKQQDLGSYFLDENNVLWKMNSWCEYPSVELENVETKQRISFAACSPMANTFKKLVVEKESEENNGTVNN